MKFRLTFALTSGEFFGNFFQRIFGQKSTQLLTCLFKYFCSIKNVDEFQTIVNLSGQDAEDSIDIRIPSRHSCCGG